LKGLLNQTIPAEAIYLNLPDSFGRTGETYTMPYWFPQYADKVIVNRCGKDLGPITKLVPVLSHIPVDEDVWIMTADDDIRPIPYAIELYTRVIETTMTGSKRVIGMGGAFFDRKRMYGPKAMMTPVEIIEGYGMPVYHRSFFQKDFLGYVDTCIQHKPCMMSDDVIISNWLSLRRIPKEQVGVPWCNRFIIMDQQLMPYGLKEDSLHEIEKNEIKYTKSYDYLRSKGILGLIDPNDWDFFPKMDSPGNDISCVGSKRVEELMIDSLKETTCVAFNTKGFLKSAVNDRVTVNEWSDGDGLYVLKQK